MLTVQQDLFQSRTSFDADYLASGYFSSVWAHPDGETIIKRCRANDGTMAWLYWCFMEQQATGERRKHTPLVHSMVRLQGGGYIATMKRYKEYDNTKSHHVECKSSLDSARDISPCCMPHATFTPLIEAWRETWLRVHDDPYGAFSDMHSGNVMFDGDELIITDPSADRVEGNLALMFPMTAEFTLQ